MDDCFHIAILIIIYNDLKFTFYIFFSFLITFFTNFFYSNFKVTIFKKLFKKNIFPYTIAFVYCTFIINLFMDLVSFDLANPIGQQTNKFDSIIKLVLLLLLLIVVAVIIKCPCHWPLVTVKTLLYLVRLMKIKT